MPRQIIPMLLVANKGLLALAWLVLFFFAGQSVSVDDRAILVTSQALAYFSATCFTFGLGLHAARYPNLVFFRFFIRHAIFVPICVCSALVAAYLGLTGRSLADPLLVSLIWGAVLSVKINSFDYFVSRQSYCRALCAHNFIEYFVAGMIFLAFYESSDIYLALWSFPIVLCISPIITSLLSFRLEDDNAHFDTYDFIKSSLPSALYRLMSTRKKEFAVSLLGLSAVSTDFIWLFGLCIQLLAAMNLPFVALQSWIIGAFSQERDEEVRSLWVFLLAAQLIFVLVMTAYVDEFLILFSSTGLEGSGVFLVILVWSRFLSLCLGPVIERSLQLNINSYLIWIGFFEMLLIGSTIYLAPAAVLETIFVVVFSMLFWVAPLYGRLSRVNEKIHREA